MKNTRTHWEKPCWKYTSTILSKGFHNTTLTTMKEHKEKKWKPKSCTTLGRSRSGLDPKWIQIRHTSILNNIQAVECILCYLKKNLGKGLLFMKSETTSIEGYANAN